MSLGNGSSIRHTVDLLGSVRDELTSIARLAAQQGRGGEITQAFAQIISRLRTNPRAFGEPLYELRKMRMQVLRATVPPLYVEYGLHEDRPVVIIRRIVWLNNSTS